VLGSCPSAAGMAVRQSSSGSATHLSALVPGRSLPLLTAPYRCSPLFTAAGLAAASDVFGVTVGGILGHAMCTGGQGARRAGTAAYSSANGTAADVQAGTGGQAQGSRQANRQAGRSALGSAQILPEALPSCQAYLSPRGSLPLQVRRYWAASTWRSTLTSAWWPTCEWASLLYSAYCSCLPASCLCGVPAEC